MKNLTFSCKETGCIQFVNKSGTLIFYPLLPSCFFWLLSKKSIQIERLLVPDLKNKSSLLLFRPLGIDSLNDVLTISTCCLLRTNLYSYLGFAGHVARSNQSPKGWRHMTRVTADQIYPFQLRCWQRSLSLPQPRDLYVSQRSKAQEMPKLKTLAFIWQTF